MGHERTRRLRLYPVNGKIESIDIDKVLIFFDEPGRASSQIVCTKNIPEICYDISFVSSTRNHENVQIDKKTTIVWELLSPEEFPTVLGNITEADELNDGAYEPAIFMFDKIVIKGSLEKLKTFHKEIFPNWNLNFSNDKIIQDQLSTILLVNGCYTYCNQNEIGDSRIKKRINREEDNFRLNFKLQHEFHLFEEFLPKNIGLDSFEEFIHLTSEYSTENIYGGISVIEFYFKNRLLKTLEWKEMQDLETKEITGRWAHYSADWWDNCINVKYQDFVTEFKRKNK
jgi:hypothetical protein